MEISDETFFRMVSACQSAVQFSKLAPDLIALLEELDELLELPRIGAMLTSIRAIQLVAMPSPDISRRLDPKQWRQEKMP
jgi:hypothetical protein